jgi:hypothetical protein
MVGDWPRTGAYMSVGELYSVTVVIKVVKGDIPMMTPATSQVTLPKRGSVTYLRSSRKIGSRRTSSRPARAVRRPSR